MLVWVCIRFNEGGWYFGVSSKQLRVGMKITPIILNEQTHPARTLKTIIFNAYVGRLFVRRVLRSCWCTFPFFHRYENQSGTTVKVWDRWKSCKHSCIPLGWYPPRSITTRRFRTDTYYPFSLPSWCLLIARQAIICMLTHSWQKWLSATFFSPSCCAPSKTKLSLLTGGVTCAFGFKLVGI